MTVKEFAPIQQRLMEFVRREFKPGHNHYAVSKLIGDASSRQYYRYGTDFDESFILAAYPEPFNPDQFAYRQIYDLLRQIDLPVPEILCMDGPLGIVLQEDLGNLTLQKFLMKASEQDRRSLLKRAIDYIVRIQEQGSHRLTPRCEGYHLAFNEEKLSWEFWFFRRHYLGNYRNLKLKDEESLFEEFDRIARELSTAPRFLCHRDYHIRNLMMKEEELYIIDFQDARWGPVSYDLVSLLKDSIDLTDEAVAEHIGDYLNQSSLNLKPEEFLRQFHLMSIQRLLKALGTYGYQVIVREHFIYEQYMSGSLHRALKALEQVPEFPHTQKLIESELAL